MAIERMQLPVGKKFDYQNPKHVDAAMKTIADQGHGTGWQVQSFDPAEGVLTVSRRSALTTVTKSKGTKTDSYRVELMRGIKPTDGDQIAAQLESDPQHAGYFMTRFEPFISEATMSKLTEDELRARAAVALVLGVKPWDVQVGRRRGGGFTLGLPGNYVPSKHDEKLDEIAQVAIGRPGWYFRGDANKLTGEIVPSTPATFPRVVPYPMEMMPSPDVHGLPPIPLGLSLAERGDQPNKPLTLDFSAAPHLQLGGVTGAGKLLPLDTPIPTPTGWVSMGDLEVGDKVLGRDGRPCTVTFLSDINKRPELYRLTLSDGQTIDADADHQWVASDFGGRNAHKSSNHVNALAQHAACAAAVSTLRGLAAELGDTRLTLDELRDLVAPIPGLRWKLSDSIRSCLKFLNVPMVTVIRPKLRPGRAAFTRLEPLSGFNPQLVLTALAKDWLTPRAGRGIGVRSPRRQLVKAAATATRLAAAPLPGEMTAKKIWQLLADDGATLSYQTVASGVKRCGLSPLRGYREVQYPAGREHVMRVPMNAYVASDALGALAARAEFLNGESLRVGFSERIVTTAEMLAEGVRDGRDGANWAIRVTNPIDLPKADLPVAPYTMGAWLGDGSSNGRGFTGIDPQIWEEIERDGYEVRHSPGCKSSHTIVGLVSRLSSTLRLESDATYRKFDKRIPVAYLRASYDQRLALLQGLMDTDGTISQRGGCELSLNKHALAEDALELIRSLGIKASITEGVSSYKKGGIRVVTGTRYRIKFTTDIPVFRLSRKRERVPASLRETSEWLYIVSIEPVPTRPGRCIQVDSPDSTYLCSAFVPTHNTVALNAIIAGALAGGAELVIIDVPQKSVDFEAWRPFVRSGGWGCESYEENATTLEQLYKEGEQRAAAFKRYGVKKLADLPADIRSSMPEVVIIVDEVTGLFSMDTVPKKLDADDPLRIEAESRNYARELIKTFIEKIAAEQRFVGYHLVLSTQVASVNTGIGTSLRTNLPHKLLLGPRATDGNRKLILTDVTSVPMVPDHIKVDPDASLGVGVAELAGQPASVWKGFFASESELTAELARRHVPRLPSTQLDSTRPDPSAVMARFPDVATVRQAKAEAEAPAYGKSPRQYEAWELDPETGKPLTGYARANAARHAVTEATR